MEKETAPRRLCSEIQLFDLCSRDACAHRDGRFCTDPDILARFEAISEEDQRLPDRFTDEDLEEGEETDDLCYDESPAGDEFGEDEPEEEDF